MDIKKNEVFAFIGPSGCGKTTFLRVLNRMNDLIPKTSIKGSVRIAGQEIYDSSVDVVRLRKSVGTVFQKPNPFPISIFNNVAYGPKAHGIKSKKKLMDIVEDSLRKAALWDEVKDRLKDSATGLSGGQQQRLCIARVSDKTAFFLNGSIIETSETNRLFMNPREKETEDYITGKFG